MCPACNHGKGTRHCDDGHYSCGTRVVDGEIQESRRCVRYQKQRAREIAWEQEQARA